MDNLTHDCKNCVHAECCGRNIEKVKLFESKMISEEEAYYVSELFKAMSRLGSEYFSRFFRGRCACAISLSLSMSLNLPYLIS